MPETTLGVGIIGVSPVRGWAATAHIPALRALPNYEIRALTAHSAESARAAGEVFGVSAVFSDHEQLVTQPDIDLVAVTVKVPHHRELVSAALAGGTGFLWEINGTAGTLRITADSAQPQIFPLTVAGAKGGNEPAELPAPAASTQKWPALTSLEGAPAYNVGRAYATFAADIHNGSQHRAGLRRRRPTPRGHRRHREVRGIRGTRQSIDPLSSPQRLLAAAGSKGPFARIRGLPWRSTAAS
jgi:predicted dehydrogenase